MKNLFSVIKEIISEVKDFFVKLWRTSRFLFKQFMYFLKIIFLWIKYYIYQFFNLIYQAFLYLVDGIKWIFRKMKQFIIFIWNLIKRFFRLIYELFVNIFHYIYIFIKYLASKIISFFKWLFKVFKNMILNFPQFILFLLTLIFVLVISLFISIYLFVKDLVSGLLNRNYRLDDAFVLGIKPLYILPVNLVDGHILALRRLASKKKKVLSVDTKSHFKDLVDYTTFAWLLVIGSILLLVAIVATLSVALVFGLISVNSVPKDESKVLDYFKKRLVMRRNEVETSFNLKPTVFRGYKISWESKNPNIISSEGILNNANPRLKDVESANFLVKIEKGTIYSYEFQILVRYNITSEALLRTYRNIMLPEKISENINFDSFKASPHVELDVESINSNVITDKGFILSSSFSKKIKVYFKIKIIHEDYYMQKRVSTFIVNDNQEKYLKFLVKNTPESIEVRKGRIKFKTHKAVKVSFNDNDARVISNYGLVYPSDYDVENKIEVIYSIGDLKSQKVVVLSRKGSKKGLKNELKQIIIPKFDRDASVIKLPLVTEPGDDGFSYHIKWYRNNESVNHIETDPVIKKPYIIKLLAKINVNGINGTKEVKLFVPRRSSDFACKYDLDNLEPLITHENRLFLPKQGKGFKAKIFWISQTPTIVSSRGILRKAFMIEQSKKKVAVIRAIVVYKTRTITMDYKFFIEDNKFKGFREIKGLQEVVNTEREAIEKIN